jgi:hypothetical protein
MSSDMMRFAINVLLPIALLIGWLIAEFHCRRWVRVSLGLACLLFPFLWIWAVTYSTNMLLSLHKMGIHRIEILIQDGQEARVQRALKVYDETYQDTGSTKAAVFCMNSVLMDDDPNGKERVDNKIP